MAKDVRTSQDKQLTRIIRPLRNGQITIPAEFRRQLGITDDSLLQISLEDEVLHIRKMRTAADVDGSPWLAELYDRFAPVRQEAIDHDYTEDEIDEAIDAAIAAVRQHHA